MKKGFTLIELLAVIVILSVITLITVPMITNVIEESKKKALASSVEGLVESANLYAIEKDGVYEFLFDKEHQGSTIKGESLDYRGNIDGEGKLYLDKEGNVSVCISNNNYYVYKNYNSGIIVGERSKDNCNIEYDALTNKYVAFLESKGSESNVYSKDKVDNLVDSLDTKITNNTSEITNIKSNIEELQNNLNNYALQSELEKTNSNMENLSSIITVNQNSINDLKDKLSWHVIDGGGSTIVQDEGLKTATEISVYMGYGSIVRTAPADAFETMYGVGIDISLYAYNRYYSNFSYIKLDRSQGKLTSSFQYGENYTEANSFIKVYYR